MPGLRKVEEPAFWYMVLGEYPPQGENTLISEAWLFAARTRWDTYVSLYGERPPAGVTPILAIDIAEMGTDYNVACLRYGGYVARLKLWNGMDPDASAQRAMALYREHGAHLAMIDGTGIGSSVAPSMARQGRDDNIRAVSVKVSEKPSPFIKSELGEFKRLRDQLWWATREWLRTDPGAMLPPDPMLVEELRLPTYEVRNGDIVVMTKEKMRDLLRRSPDRADALVLSHAPFERAKVMRLVV
jgi:hypothetical protein